MSANEEVKTTFNVDDKAAGPLGQLSVAFAGVGGLIGKVTGMFNPLNAAIAGLASAVSVAKLVNLGDQFEQTQISIAGFMSSLGISKDFDSGFKDAAAVMEQIRVSAAALPGEAEDYIAVFKANLPVVQAAVGGTVTQMTQFTNRYTAIAKTLQVDTGQAARDLTLMLREGMGGAGLRVKTWSQMLPFMKKLEGQAQITATKFNAMTAPERAKLLEATLKNMDPMLKKSAGSYDAMIGALKSNTSEILRLGSAPMFEGMKVGLEKVNAIIFDSEGNLTRWGHRIVNIGKVISRVLVAAFEKVHAVIDDIGKALEGFSKSPAFTAIIANLNKVIGTVHQGGKAASENKTGAAAVGAGGGAAAAGAAAFGPIGLALGPVVMGLINFSKNTEKVGQLFTHLSSILSSGVSIVSGVMGVLTSLGDLFGDFMEGVLVPIAGVFDAVLLAATPLVNQLWAFVSNIMVQVRPALNKLWSSVGTVITALGSLLVPVIRIAFAAMLNMWGIVSKFVIPVFNMMVEATAKLQVAFAGFISWLGKLLSSVASKVEGLNADKGGAKADAGPDYLGDFLKKLKGMGDAPPTSADAGKGGGAAGAGGAGGGARGGGGRNVQNFMYSKFEITQKFAEGFDPDRIAVAFSKDIGNLGEQKLQSGFEPLFSIR